MPPRLVSAHMPCLPHIALPNHPKAPAHRVEVSSQLVACVVRGCTCCCQLSSAALQHLTLHHLAHTAHMHTEVKQPSGKNTWQGICNTVPAHKATLHHLVHTAQPAAVQTYSHQAKAHPAAGREAEVPDNAGRVVLSGCCGELMNTSL
jgi:hypothetical protein